MNDLSGLEVVPKLKKLGIASLKIEGRLRSAHYVRNVVKAYRQMIDAKEHELDKTLVDSERLIDEAMSRKVSPGYFKMVQPVGAITPFHSGNMGLHLGSVEKVKRIGSDLLGRLTLKYALERGDRLRCHFEVTGERTSFTVKKLFTNNTEVANVAAGNKAELLLPQDYPNVPGKVDIYKVDTRTQSHEYDTERAITIGKKKFETIRVKQRKRIKKITDRIIIQSPEKLPSKTRGKGQGAKAYTAKQDRGKSSNQMPLECWLRLDSVDSIFYKLPFKANRFIVKIDSKNVSKAGKLKQYLGKSVRDVIWALPPILLKNELIRIQKLLKTLQRSGYRSFQLGHISQADLFSNQRVHLCGDYTLNLMNHQSILWAETAGLKATQLSIELDRQCLKSCLRGYKAQRSGDCKIGLTVYGTPPLFTSRLAPKHFQYDKELKSPKDETFIIKKMAGFTQTFASKPFSLLLYMEELKRFGLDYAVIDLSNMGKDKKEMQSVADILSGKNKFLKLPTFNYLGNLE